MLVRIQKFAEMWVPFYHGRLDSRKGAVGRRKGGGVERNTPRVIHVFNNLLLGSCSGQLRMRPARTRGPPPPPFVNYIMHKNNGMYKCREKC